MRRTLFRSNVYQVWLSSLLNGKILKESLQRSTAQGHDNPTVNRIAMKIIPVAEKVHSDDLAQLLNGKREVCTPVGRIDVLTDSEVIEVKHVSGWKGAVGQVVIYSAFYPTHGKRIHLFGDSTFSQREVIEIASSKAGVRVTWADLKLANTKEVINTILGLEEKLHKQNCKLVYFSLKEEPGAYSRLSNLFLEIGDMDQDECFRACEELFVEGKIKKSKAWLCIGTGGKLDEIYWLEKNTKVESVEEANR